MHETPRRSASKYDFVKVGASSLMIRRLQRALASAGFGLCSHCWRTPIACQKSKRT